MKLINAETYSRAIQDYFKNLINKHKTEVDVVDCNADLQRLLNEQTTINEVATRYMVFFFTALRDVYGYGKVRLNRVADFLNNLLTDYQGDRKSLREWKAAILDEAGIYIEPPVDPKTQDNTSTMMGDY